MKSLSLVVSAFVPTCVKGIRSSFENHWHFHENTHTNNGRLCCVGLCGRRVGAGPPLRTFQQAHWVQRSTSYPMNVIKRWETQCNGVYLAKMCRVRHSGLCEVASGVSPSGEPVKLMLSARNRSQKLTFCSGCPTFVLLYIHLEHFNTHTHTDTHIHTHSLAYLLTRRNSGL